MIRSKSDLIQLECNSILYFSSRPAINTIYYLGKLYSPGLFNSSDNLSIISIMQINKYRYKKKKKIRLDS